MNVYALHGFLGLPSDWSFLTISLHENFKIHPIDLYGSNYTKPSEGLWKWANSFKSSIDTKNNVLLGYSLGGRLALHSLAAEPKLWNAAIIVSANPGNLDPNEKKARLDIDIQWSKRFETEEWQSLMNAWNNQSVFNGSLIQDRHERNYLRANLTATLTGWSVASQDNLLEKIQSLNIPILWIAGEKDQKYADQAKKLSLQHSHSKIWIAPGVGHRVPWDDQTAFCNEITKFLNLGR